MPQPLAHTRLPVAADARVDEPRVERREVGGPKLPLLHHPRAEVLDQDVGARREPPRERAPLLVVEVDRDAALVAPVAAPPERLAGRVERAQRAQRVALGRLDLDHVGAKVAEHRAGKVARDDLAEVEHLLFGSGY